MEGAKYCNENVCLFVCLLSTRITRKPRGRTSPDFLRVLPVAVARSSITAEIPSKFRSAIKTGSADRELRTGAKSAVYDCLEISGVCENCV